jgi:hypothetical protein
VTTAVDLDSLVQDYLDQLRAALGPAAPDRREAYVADIAEHLAQAREELPVGDELALRNLLDRVGRPEDLAAAELEAEAEETEAGPGAGPEQQAAPSPPSGPGAAPVLAPDPPRWWRRPLFLGVLAAALLLLALLAAFWPAPPAHGHSQPPAAAGVTLAPNSPAAAGGTAGGGRAGVAVLAPGTVPAAAGSGSPAGSSTTATSSASGPTSPVAWVVGTQPPEILAVHPGTGSVGTPVALPADFGTPTQVFVSPDGSTGYVVSSTGAQLVDLSTGALGPTLTGDPGTEAAGWALEPDGHTLVEAAQDGTVGTLDTADPARGFSRLAAVAAGGPVAVLGTTAYVLSGVPADGAGCPQACPFDTTVTPVGLSGGQVGPAVTVGTPTTGTSSPAVALAAAGDVLVVRLAAATYELDPADGQVSVVGGTGPAAGAGTPSGQAMVEADPGDLAVTGSGSVVWLTGGANALYPVDVNLDAFGHPLYGNATVTAVAVTGDGTSLLGLTPTASALVLDPAAGSVSSTLTLPDLGYGFAAFTPG